MAEDMTTDAGQTLADVIRRLDAEEAERAIVRTLHRYVHTLDYGVEDEWLDCFTDDGVFDVRYREGTVRPDSGPPFRYEGRQALARFIAGHTRAPERYHKHLVSAALVTIDGGDARADSYFMRIDDHRGRPYVRSFGRYRDRLVRGADGAWRFALRVVEMESRGGDAPPWPTEAAL